MPSHELYAFEIRPLRGYELNGRWVTRVEGERSDRREGVAEEVGDEGGIGGGGGGEGVTPGREE